MIKSNCLQTVVSVFLVILFRLSNCTIILEFSYKLPFSSMYDTKPQSLNLPWMFLVSDCRCVIQRIFSKGKILSKTVSSEDSDELESDEVELDELELDELELDEL